MARTKAVTPHDRLLSLVRARTEKQTEFNYGILTADRYVKRFLDEIGDRACHHHMCQTNGGWASLDDVVRKAAETLSYINADMEVKAKGEDELPSSIRRPKNTLMVFRHVLTTSIWDRDGDRLRTKGAILDPKMLLLWQHAHTLPIGKMLAVASHTKDELQLYSCIVDVNELCHDAAVMLDNDMGRFSHGFRAIDFLELKGRRGSSGGFDVKEFEILEESLVSVPANPDAETEEVLLSLVEGRKLTSPLMKDYGRAVRERLPLSVPVELDLKVLINNQEVESYEDESRDEAREGDGAESGSPEKASADGGRKERRKERRKEGSAEADEVKQEMFSCECIKCGYEVETKEHCKDIECPKCGGTMRRKERPGAGEEVKDFEMATYQPEGQKPYPNEHALRLNDPGKYKRIRRQNDKFGSGIHAIFGITEDGKTELQAIRFSADKFTAEEARKWLEDHDYKTSGFEPAKKPKKQLIEDSASGGGNVVLSREGQKMVCPECVHVGPSKDGKCPECGAVLVSRKDFILEKAGRVLNKANEQKIRDAMDDLDEVAKMKDISRACKSLVGQARRGLGEVIASLGDGEGAEKIETEMDTKQALAVLLATGGEKELKVMSSILEAIEKSRREDEMAKQYAELFD